MAKLPENNISDKGLKSATQSQNVTIKQFKTKNSVRMTNFSKAG